MVSYSSVSNPAGEISEHFYFWNIPTRINRLINHYLTWEILSDRLEDLPLQFTHPQPRPWQPIDWQTIDTQQIVGIDVEVFLAIIVGAVNTEAPIRGYTQTSRQYLAPIHPQMAQFVGGIATKDEGLLELGLWEKEERQHAPALSKIYQQLTGQKLILQPHQPKKYQPSEQPEQDLYRHGLHRVITEYGATCLYFWLMAHTKATLQQVSGELLQDEINHMTKFFGFGLWLFPRRSTPASPLQSITRLNRTFRRLMKVLDWDEWSWLNKMELVYTFICVGYRLWRWNSILTSEYLQQLFGPSPLLEYSNSKE